jgi:hypothetical protein
MGRPRFSQIDSEEVKDYFEKQGLIDRHTVSNMCIPSMSNCPKCRVSYQSGSHD